MTKRTKTKQKKEEITNKKGKNVSVLELFRELFVWHRELAVFRNNVLIKCNWYLSIETFMLQASTKISEQHGSSSLEAADISYKNTKHLSRQFTLFIPSLTNPICFWQSTTVSKYWEINLAGFTRNAAIDKHKWVHSAPTTYLGGFSIRVFLYSCSWNTKHPVFVNTNTTRQGKAVPHPDPFYTCY